jgi:hypothetical protein
LWKEQKCACYVEMVSKESRLSYGKSVPNYTVMGTISRNKMDTHADTCCAGANWQLLDFTNKVGNICLSVTKCYGLEVKWITH